MKPLPTINPKDKGKSILEEPEPAKKMTRSDFDAAQIVRDVEIARQLQVDLQAEPSFNRMKERSIQLNKEQSSWLKQLLLKENSELYKDLLRLEKFKVCMKDKRVIDDFKPMDSDDAVKDSKEAAGVHKQKVLEEPNSTKVEIKKEGHEESIWKRPGRRLKMKATKKSKRQKIDANLEEEEQLKAFLKIVPNEEGIIDYEVLEKRFPIINCIYYRIFRSDGISRWITTFLNGDKVFDRLDLKEN
ncbi:hypothetical protein Tco_0232868 [Tanacetum coccineum]